MIELRIEISRVEYTEVFDRFVPNLLTSLKNKDDLKHPMLKLAAKRPETAAKMVKSFINALSDHKKEQLICRLVNSNQEAIVEALNKLCQKNDINVVISEGEATYY